MLEITISQNLEVKSRFSVKCCIFRGRWNFKFSTPGEGPTGDFGTGGHRPGFVKKSGKVQNLGGNLLSNDVFFPKKSRKWSVPVGAEDPPNFPRRHFQNSCTFLHFSIFWVPFDPDFLNRMSGIRDTFD